MPNTLSVVSSRPIVTIFEVLKLLMNSALSLATLFSNRLFKASTWTIFRQVCFSRNGIMFRMAFHVTPVDMIIVNSSSSNASGGIIFSLFLSLSFSASSWCLCVLTWAAQFFVEISFEQAWHNFFDGNVPFLVECSLSKATSRDLAQVFMCRDKFDFETQASQPGQKDKFWKIALDLSSASKALALSPSVKPEGTKFDKKSSKLKFRKNARKVVILFKFLF